MKCCKSIYCEVHYKRYITTPFVSLFVFDNNIKFATIPKQKGCDQMVHPFLYLYGIKP